MNVPSACISAVGICSKPVLPSVNWARKFVPGNTQRIAKNKTTRYLLPNPIPQIRFKLRASHMIPAGQTAPTEMPLDMLDIIWILQKGERLCGDRSPESCLGKSDIKRQLCFISYYDSRLFPWSCLIVPNLLDRACSTERARLRLIAPDQRRTAS